MQSLLADFLNHGILPFTGRSAEIARIDAFWRAATEAQELRAALIIGEAGIGKSRLIEETIPRIVQGGGAVVHTKLYPDSTSSIAPLVARALRILSTRRQLQIGEPDDTIPSVAAAMRRLARLRPTVLIIEDLHLLEGVSLREFTRLLEALADEPIALLAAARPVDLPARGILERYFVEEIPLKGLSEKSMGELWNTLFSAPADARLLRPLRGATLGNPLALRSALRGAIRAGSFSHDIVTNSWHSTSSAEEFARSLKKNVELLSEGMAAHLSSDEKEGSMLLASLGEVFARETAEAITGGNTKLIESLIFKGILAPASIHISPILGGEPDRFPLVFTHTLIHRQFVEHGTPDSQRLVEIIASDLPLYSVIPFQLLLRQNMAIPDRTRRLAINRALLCSLYLDQGIDWKLAIHAVEAASFLTETGEWEPEEQRRMRLRVIKARLSSLRRDSANKVYHRLVERMYELSGDEDEVVASFRIVAYLHMFRHIGPGNAIDDCLALWEKGLRIVEKFPSLRHTTSYLGFLQAALKEVPDASATMAPLVEREVESVLAEISNDEEHARLVVVAKNLIYPYLLRIYSTPEELERREQMLGELDVTNIHHQPTVIIQKIKFLMDIGRAMDVVALSRAYGPRFRDLGLRRNLVNCQTFELGALNLQGLPLGVIPARVEEICVDAPADTLPGLRPSMGEYFSTIGVLRGDPAWSRTLLHEYGVPIGSLSWMHRVTLALPEDRADVLSAIAGENDAPPQIRAFAALLNDPEGKGAVEGMREALRAPIISINAMFVRYAILELVVWAGDSPAHRAIAAALAPDLREALEMAADWYKARQLPAMIAALLDRHGDRWEPKRLAHWRRVVNDLTSEQIPVTIPRREDARQRLTMIGTIELRQPDGTATQVRGSRLRALLGLLVADRMLEKPLSHREMAAILSGAEDDPDKARKTLNGVVFRLRETMGNEAVLTDRDTPRLNTDLLTVDLLDAHKGLREASAALDERSLGRALQSLLGVLEISCCDVPFPTLYENFFEALREDFENELRNGVIRVARGLLNEGDPKSAEELLRRALAGMPGDEDVADLLREALLVLGKRAEAERIRLQTSLETT